MTAALATAAERGAGEALQGLSAAADRAERQERKGSSGLFYAQPGQLLAPPTPMKTATLDSSAADPTSLDNLTVSILILSWCWEEGLQSRRPRKTPMAQSSRASRGLAAVVEDALRQGAESRSAPVRPLPGYPTDSSQFLREPLSITERRRKRHRQEHGPAAPPALGDPAGRRCQLGEPWVPEGGLTGAEGQGWGPGAAGGRGRWEPAQGGAAGGRSGPARSRVRGAQGQEVAGGRGRAQARGPVSGGSKWHRRKAKWERGREARSPAELPPRRTPQSPGRPPAAPPAPPRDMALTPAWRCALALALLCRSAGGLAASGDGDADPDGGAAAPRPEPSDAGASPAQVPRPAPPPPPVSPGAPLPGPGPAGLCLWDSGSAPLINIVFNTEIQLGDFESYRVASRTGRGGRMETPSELTSLLSVSVQPALGDGIDSPIEQVVGRSDRAAEHYGDFKVHKCEAGSFRAFSGQCLPCDCNGHSSECLDGSGFCVHCQRNTTGEHCERCLDGYIGDAFRGAPRSCQPCPCPLPHLASFAESCYRKNGAVRCVCKENYAGPNCERCAPGYYGNPLLTGSTCKKCDCSGNSDPNLIFEDCDEVTGQCRNCLRNTTGFKCERCAPGYYGDARVAKNCAVCSCGGGPCDGVTGECLEEGLELPTGTDCPTISCDKCVWDLTDDLRLAALSIQESRSGLLSVSSGAAAHRHVSDMNVTIYLLKTKLSERENQCVLRKVQLSSAESTVRTLAADAEDLATRGSQASRKGQGVQKESVDTVSHATQLEEQARRMRETIQEISDKMLYYGEQQELGPEEVAEKLALAQEMLEEIRHRPPFLTQRELVDAEADEAYELLSQAESWQRLHNDTRALFPVVLEQLGDHNAKLSDLQESLDQARDHIRDAEDMNRAMAARQRDHEKQQERVRAQAEAVNASLSTSADSLATPRRTLVDLDDIIKNASGIYAEIDGAQKELQGKHSNRSGLSYSLVQEATDHARNLQEEAEELSRSLHSSDMNGLVQKALDASNVYENIISYVGEANDTAELALNITDRIYDAVSGIDTQTIYHKDESDNLLHQARQLQAKADASNEEVVTDTSRRVGGAQARKSALKYRLDDALKQLQATETGQTQQRLGQSKLIVTEANKTAVDVQQVTAPMTNNLTNWSQNLQNFDSSAYNTAVDSATDAVRSLTEVVPQLLDQLRTVEQKRPASNVSASIQRIRELIAQTRSVASKIQVSVMFGGNSAVDVHPKTSLDDLKAFTSLSLYMKPPVRQPDQAGPADQFVLYLGSKHAKKEYMGLAIKNDNLVYIYNLGTKDVEIPLDSKPVSSWPAYFSLVKIERVGKHGKVFLTVPSLSSTAEEKFIKKGEVAGDDSLLDLDPEDTVFYVGGVPANFKLPPSLNLPGFLGCLELATLNNDVISLYNFKHIYNVDPSKAVPCARDKLAFTQSRAASYFFDGSSYAVVRDITRRGKFGQVTRFDIEVRTPVDNGLVLLMVNGSAFFSLEMRGGYLHVFYDFGFSHGPVHLEDTLRKAPINDAKYHEISIIYHNDKKMILVVDRRHVKSVDNEKTKIPFTDMYIGGAPPEILHSRALRGHLPLDINFRGCMKGFQFQKKDFNLLEQTETLGVGYGCPEDSLISRRAYFNGQSFVASTQKISFFDGFEGGFTFRTLQPNGLLFYSASGADVFSISLDNGTVVMDVKGVQVQSADKQYHDGQPHLIVASVSPTRYELVVDQSKLGSKSPTKGKAQRTPEGERKFYLGGSPISPRFANFTGCISNAYFTRLDRDVEVEDFQRYSEKAHASLSECPIESSPLFLRHKKEKNSSKSKSTLNRKGGKSKDAPLWDPVGLKFPGQGAPRNSLCHLSSSPRAIEGAYQFGGAANSRQEFEDLPGDFGEKSHFSIRLKTRSSHGMIFYVSDQDENDFMTLFLAHGRLVFMFNIGHRKLKLRSQERYNDGTWHDVIFIREKSSGRLVIDGLRVLEESFPPTEASWKIKGPIYLGGVAPGRAVKNVQINSVYSFNGCLSNLQLNGASIPSASQTFSVTPCFEGPMEIGTYFSTEGGYVVLDESFNIGLKFEIAFEIRPRSSSGTLVHGHSVSGEYLNIHMKNGQVIVKINNGIRDFSTSVTPKQSLCDGRWHRITVIGDSNVVQLDVDSEVNHVVGPLNPKPVGPREPVFVGGVPESLLAPRLAPSKPFAGCIRHFGIDGRPVSFSKAALVSGAVSVASCPMA
ncbi:laminin subunit alpha-4 [Ctenodactylus gundi]